MTLESRDVPSLRLKGSFRLQSLRCTRRRSVGLDSFSTLPRGSLELGGRVSGVEGAGELQSELLVLAPHGSSEPGVMLTAIGDTR